MLRLLFALFIMLTLSACSTIRSTKLLAPGWFGFTQISHNVYVDDEMPEDQQQDILKTLSFAKKRVSTFFDGLQGSPKVFACSTEECFISHGGISAKGKAYGSSMLLLSPRGLNVVIMAHELSHIELSYRIGTIRTARTIPAWFNEGLAVLVSEDPRYTEQAWLEATDYGRKAPDLDDIGGMLGQGSWLLSYGTARRKVDSWYRQAGHTGLKRLIQEIKDGNDFNESLN